MAKSESENPENTAYARMDAKAGRKNQENISGKWVRVAVFFYGLPGTLFQCALNSGRAGFPSPLQVRNWPKFKITKINDRLV